MLNSSSPVVSEASSFALEQMPGYYSLKDAESKTLFMSHKMMALCGYKETKEYLGASDFDIKCKAAEFAENFIQQDKQAIKNQYIRNLGYFCYAKDQWKLVITEKNSFIGPHGEVKVWGHMIDVSDIRLIDLTVFLMKTNPCESNKLGRHQFCYMLDNNYDEIDLSQRQSECLFFLLRGKSAKSIAKLLNISYRTVESYIEDIKYRLACSSKSEIIEKAWKLGYMNILPESLINKELITMLE